MALGRCVVNSMYTVPAELPTGRNYGATLASGHLTQRLDRLRCDIIQNAVRSARAECCIPLVSPRAAPLASEQLFLKTECLRNSDANPVQVAISQARQIGVGNAGSGVGMQVSAPSNTTYLKRKMDMIDDPRIVGPKVNQYANIQVPRPLPACQIAPQRLPNAKEPIPVPQFRCALLNILVSN